MEPLYSITALCGVHFRNSFHLCECIGAWFSLVFFSPFRHFHVFTGLWTMHHNRNAWLFPVFHKFGKQLVLQQGSVIRAPMVFIRVVAGLCPEKTHSLCQYLKESIAVFFKGADTMFFVQRALHSEIQPRVSRCGLVHGNTVHGHGVVAQLTTRCLCALQRKTNSNDFGGCSN